jgi:hypothetical protein
MGHHYRYQFTFQGLTGLTAPLALWEIHQTAPATSLPLFFWNFQCTLSNSDAAAAAGNVVLRLQRETTLVHTGGSAGVIAKCHTGSPTSGATVNFGAPTLTAGTPTTAGKLASFGTSAFFVGATQFFEMRPIKRTDDTWSPICSVGGTEQLALVIDIDVPASVAFLVTGSIEWSEGP